MTHPLTPREKAQVPCSKCREADIMLCDCSLPNRTALASGSGDHSGGVTDMIGSGGHAELAALREHRIAVDLLVSTLKADKAEAERRLAEAESKLEDVSDQCSRWIGAHDEAVGLLEPFSEAAECLEDQARDTDHIWEQPAAMCISAGQLRAISAFLSKEAERG